MSHLRVISSRLARTAVTAGLAHAAHMCTTFNSRQVYCLTKTDAIEVRCGGKRIDWRRPDIAGSNSVRVIGERDLTDNPAVLNRPVPILLRRPTTVDRQRHARDERGGI